MEMCYNEALVMPGNYVVMNNDEIVYIEGGGAFTMETALKWIGATVLGGIAWDVLKWACIKVGAWAAINTAAICTVVSRVVAIAMLTVIVATYEVVIYKKLSNGDR